MKSEDKRAVNPVELVGGEERMDGDQKERKKMVRREIGEWWAKVVSIRRRNGQCSRVRIFQHALSLQTSDKVYLHSDEAGSLGIGRMWSIRKSLF